MIRPTKAKPKRRGRPASGRDRMYGARLSEELVGQIDSWALAEKLSRSEAIRRLVELGLKAKR